jgi:ABC-type sugar transport system ATPase subunit
LCALRDLTGRTDTLTKVKGKAWPVLLSVNNLVKTYGTRRAVDGVSFRVLAGQTVGLLGPNGAGKSTIVGMLCGLLVPDSGDISWAASASRRAPRPSSARSAWCRRTWRCTTICRRSRT